MHPLSRASILLLFISKQYWGRETSCSKESSMNKCGKAAGAYRSTRLTHTYLLLYIVIQTRAHGAPVIILKSNTVSVTLISPSMFTSDARNSQSVNTSTSSLARIAWCFSARHDQTDSHWRQIQKYSNLRGRLARTVIVDTILWMLAVAAEEASRGVGAFAKEAFRASLAGDIRKVIRRAFA